MDNFTISNVTPGGVAAGGDHPFLYITAQSSNPQKSTEIVADVVSTARQKLTELQNSSHVRSQDQIKLESIVDATPPKAVMNNVLTVTGAALMLSVIVTIIVAWAWDTIIVVRQGRHIPRSTSRAKEPTPRESVQTT